MHGLSDEDLAARVVAGDVNLYEVLMRRYNQRLYRIARGIVTDPVEAEDVVQQAYVNAYLHLNQFGKRSSFSTWLTKIAVYEALGRLRRRRYRGVPRGLRGNRQDAPAPRPRDAA
jgi:RNA polymerase sigma-70 factor (ECF subfamily)